MNGQPRIWIGHRRVVSAVHRVRYLTSPKPGHREESPETADPRVLKIESIGFRLPLLRERIIDVPECARRLIALANVARRSQLVEFLFAVEPATDRRHAVDVVMEVSADALKLIGAERGLLAIHGDREHIHGHLAVPNDRGDGRCLEFPPDLFLKLRRDVGVWSGAPIQSAWRSGREMEHQIARMSSAELREEITQQRLAIIRDQNGHATAICDVRDRRRRRARLVTMERLWPGWIGEVLEPVLQAQQPAQPVVAPPAPKPVEASPPAVTRYPAELVTELRARLAALQPQAPER